MQGKITQNIAFLEVADGIVGFIARDPVLFFSLAGSDITSPQE
jgi:hypothetical protein